MAVSVSKEFNGWFPPRSEASFDAPPCYFFRACKSLSVACKNGKSLCAKSIARYEGIEYPLRRPLANNELEKIERGQALYSSYPN